MELAGFVRTKGALKPVLDRRPFIRIVKARSNTS